MVATIADVARRAKVSTATVSRVLAGLGHARPETRERILAAARDLDYRPSGRRPLAPAPLDPDVRPDRHRHREPVLPASWSGPSRTPRGPRATRSCCAMPPTTRSVSPATSSCSSSGAWTALIIAASSLGGPARRVARLVAAAGGPHQHDRGRRRPAVRPVRQPGRQPPRGRSTCSTSGIAGSATSCRPPRNVDAPERLAGVRDALAAAGLDPASIAIASGAPLVGGGEAAMLELLDRAPGTTAVLAYNDLMAIGALRAIRRRGRSVPGDVSVVGFDDVALAAYVDPPLTTLSQSTGRDGLLGGRAPDRAAAGARARRRTARRPRTAWRSRRRSSCSRSASRSAARPDPHPAPDLGADRPSRGASRRVHRADLRDLRRQDRPTDALARPPDEDGRAVGHARRGRGPRRPATRPPPRTAGPAGGATGGGRRWPAAGPMPGAPRGTCRRRRSGRSRASSRVGR